MAIPPDQFRIMLQQEQKKQIEAQFYRNMYAGDGPSGRYLDGMSHLEDQPQHQRFVHPSLVTGLGAADESSRGFNLQFGVGIEPKKRKLEVQDFFENNSQISSLDILRPLPVSTGLGLSLDNGQISSSGESGLLLSSISDDISKELRQQDAEIDRFLKVQADRLKQAVLQKVQEQHLKTVSYLENKVLHKLQEKESELQMINQKNLILEERIEQVNSKLDLWKQRATYNENIINTLRHNLQNIHAQNGANKEGFGDSGVDDTASYHNGQATDLQLLFKDNNTSLTLELTSCKGCGLKEVCMLLLPCKHLCLCKECESKLSLCPLCHSSKFFGMEVYM